MQALFAQLLETGDGVPREQQLEHLVEEPRRRDVLDQRGHLADRLACVGIDAETEFCAETHRPQHPHGILAIAVRGSPIMRRVFCCRVGDAVMVVVNGLVGRIEIERIDGEVPARRIFALVSEHVVAQDAAVFVRFGGFRILSGTEGRDLDGLSHHDVNDLEATADDARPPEALADLFGRGTRGDVEILGV